MASAVPGGLRQALRARLLDGMIRRVNGESGWKVLVTDREALRILASALPVNELVNEGITIVEMLEMRREPLPRLPALYFVTPTAESVQQLVSESPTQYKELHIYFVARLPDFLMQVLRGNSALLRRVRTLVELNVPLLALEPRVFSLARLAASLPQLHAEGVKEARDEMAAVSERLAQTCSLVAPGVDWTVRSAAGNSARTVASLVKEQIDTANLERRVRPEQPQEEEGYPEKATLLVVDRADDLVSPLVHEFSYQAIVHDLLAVDYHRPGGAHLEVPDGEDGKTKHVQLDDEQKDPLWNEVRSLFIEEALARAQKDFRYFLENDAAFKIRGKDTANVDIKDMSAAVRALPDSQLRADKFALHIKAAKECLEACTNYSLSDLALVEQDLILGRQSDATRIRPEFMVECITEILTEDAIPAPHRFRLILMAIIVAEGLGGLGGEASALAPSGTFRAKLLRSSFDKLVQDDPNLSTAVAGLKKLLEAAKAGFHQHEPKRKLHGEVDDNMTSKLKHKYASRQQYKQQKKESAARRKRHGLQEEGELEYDVARYNPPLRSVMMDLIDEELEKDEFPTTGSVSVDSIIASATQVSITERSDSDRVDSYGKSSLKHGAANIRAHSAHVAGAFKSQFSKSDSIESGQANDDGRFRMAESNHVYVVFVLGGICYSEVRAMYEVCAKREADILLGGSAILTPTFFVDALSAVADPVVRIRVMLPPLPVELALSRAARAKALEAGRAKEAAQEANNAGTAGAEMVGKGGAGNESAEEDPLVEVVTGYKKKGVRKLFGRKKK